MSRALRLIDCCAIEKAYMELKCNQHAEDPVPKTGTLRLLKVPQLGLNIAMLNGSDLSVTYYLNYYKNHNKNFCKYIRL